MKVIIGNIPYRGSLMITISPQSKIAVLKQLIACLTGISKTLFYLTIHIHGLQVLMSDSWPLQHFKITEDTLLLMKPVKAQHKQPLNRRNTITYLQSVGLHGSLMSRLQMSPLQRAIEACKEGNLQILQLTIQEYESVHPQQDDLANQNLSSKWSLLHFASYYCHPDIIKYLVGRKVNPNKVSVDEWTPLQLCCYQGHTESVSLLLQHRSLQINKKTKYRGTALHLACQRGFSEVVKLLLDHHASIAIEDHRKRFPVQLAYMQELIELLAIYMGQEELRKYKAEEQDLEVPFCGEVYVNYSLFVNDRLMFLYMDFSKKTLERYNKKEDYLDCKPPEVCLSLTDIQDVRLGCVKKHKKKDCHYFYIETARATYKYYTLYEDFTQEWIVRLQSAVSKSLQLRQSKEEVKETEDLRTTQSSETEENVSLSDFQIMEELGTGAFGTVFKVMKIGTGQIFAMKSLSKIFLQKQGQLKYAVSECKILKYLDHPYIVKLYYAFQTSKNLYLVLEYCPNGDLLGLIQQKGVLDETTARFYLAQIILAIQHLHTHNIIYRDLKPSNVLLDQQGYVKLADFGLAKENVTVANPALTMAGSPAYLPPEIVKKRGATKSADIYGLGPLLYEILSGTPPYYSDDIGVLFKNIESSSLQFPQHFSDTVKDFILAVMQRVPDKRLQISQIKRHRLFRKIDWDALLIKRMKPPRSSIGKSDLN